MNKKSYVCIVWMNELVTLMVASATAKSIQASAGPCLQHVPVFLLVDRLWCVYVSVVIIIISFFGLINWFYGITMSFFLSPACTIRKLTVPSLRIPRTCERLSL